MLILHHSYLEQFVRVEGARLAQGDYRVYLVRHGLRPVLRLTYDGRARRDM